VATKNRTKNNRTKNNRTKNNRTNTKSVKGSHGQCCSAKQMTEGRCSAIPPAEDYFTVSGTAYQENHNFAEKLCDYIVFWNAPNLGESIALVELKGGHVPAKAAEQLKNGAGIAKGLCENPVRGFAAVLATNKRIHSIERKFIASQRIYYDGVAYPIQVISCGSRITEAQPWADVNRGKSSDTSDRKDAGGSQKKLRNSARSGKL
jgi:hypothetical protein